MIDAAFVYVLLLPLIFIIGLLLVIRQQNRRIAELEKKDKEPNLF